MNQSIQKLFSTRLKQVNSALPSYETIKKFVILPQEFSIDAGELTPTLKLKRKIICEKYREEIEKLYLSNALDSAV
ncbi:MAG: hypothetical protein GQ563_01540 [Desulfuromusa sp.]|nr:hypothetical protein [Desulfuromusa sp.]